LFGDAIIDFFNSKEKNDFVLYQHCLQKEFNDQISDFDIGIYFRNLDELFPMERKLIDLSYGNILDIGSNTGYYFPYLMEKGNTIGIEISPKINAIARKMGINNNTIGDIFSYNPITTFDTITLIGNDIALSGTLIRLKKMLKKFKKLLSENGQVLIIIRHIHTLEYWQVVYTPRYKGTFGIPSKYLFLNTHFFLKLANQIGFNTKILGKDDSTGILYYLVKLVKNC
jgi:SAM-dependent methyltransferase